MPVQLEPFLEKFLKERPEVDITQYPPELTRQGERLDLDKLNLPAVLEEEKVIPTRDGRSVSLTITRPIGSENETLPVILYLHGGGWVIGSNNTHSPIRCEVCNKMTNTFPICKQQLPVSPTKNACHVLTWTS